MSYYARPLALALAWLVAASAHADEPEPITTTEPAADADQVRPPVASVTAAPQGDAPGLAELPPPAQPPAPAPQAKVQIGWKGLSVHDSEDRFGLELHLLLQARGNLAITADGDTTATASLFRARPLLRFYAWQRKLMLTFQPELIGGARVLDARVDVTPVEGFTIAGGQLIVPFTRAWNTPLPLVEAPERSLNNSIFAPGRRLGGFVYGQPLGGKVELWAGAFEPDDPAALRDGVHAPMAMARVQVNPLGKLPATELPGTDGPAPARLGVGVAALVTPVPDASTGDDLTQVTTTADYGVQAKGFTSYGEGFVRWTEGGTLGWGVSGQLGQFLVPKHLNLMGRVTAIDTDTSDDLGARLTIEPALGGTIVGAHLMLELRYAASIGGGLATDHALTLHTQVMF